MNKTNLITSKRTTQLCGYFTSLPYFQIRDLVQKELREHFIPVEFPRTSRLPRFQPSAFLGKLMKSKPHSTVTPNA